MKWLFFHVIWRLQVGLRDVYFTSLICIFNARSLKGNHSGSLETCLAGESYNGNWLMPDILRSYKACESHNIFLEGAYRKGMLQDSLMNAEGLSSPSGADAQRGRHVEATSAW